MVDFPINKQYFANLFCQRLDSLYCAQVADFLSMRSAVWIDPDVDNLPPDFKKTMHKRIVPWVVLFIQGGIH